MITQSEYLQEWNKCTNILNNIVNICGNEKIEGNCFFKDKRNSKGLLIYPKHLLTKRMNLFMLGNKSKMILEIGFNAGHSCLHFLLSNNYSKIIVSDICSHAYTKKCFEYLQKEFPGRLELLIEGPSQETIPRYFSNKDIMFDLIHIDGSHNVELANQDLENVYSLSNGYIVFDDTWIADLNTVFEKYKKKYSLEEVYDFYDTSDTFSHRILIKYVNQTCDT